MLHRRLGDRKIALDIGVHALGDHPHGRLRHLADVGTVGSASAAEEADDLGDVGRLVADALHIGDHFQRGGNLPQVARHRLLLQKELEAERLDAVLHAVDLAVERHDLFRHGKVARGNRLARKGNDLFTKRAHLRQLAAEQRKLLVKSASHYPNLPVM